MPPLARRRVATVFDPGDDRATAVECFADSEAVGLAEA